MLSKEDKQFLLSLARESVETYFRDESPEISDDKIEKFSKKLGLFVTLHKGDDWGLRGCIGFIQSPYPLYEGIIKATRLAAFEDQRFSPLEEDELEDIEFNGAGIGNGQDKPSPGFNPAMKFLKRSHRIMQMFKNHPPDHQTKQMLRIGSGFQRTGIDRESQ